jgi:HJR/Mrr/RecB family endonuclease
MKKYINNIIEIIFTVSVIVGYINDINWLYYSGIVYYSLLFLSSIFSLIVMGYYKFDYNILSQHESKDLKDLLDQIFDKSFNIKEFIDVLMILALSKNVLDQIFDKSFNIK